LKFGGRESLIEGGGRNMGKKCPEKRFDHVGSYDRKKRIQLIDLW